MQRYKFSLWDSIVIAEALNAKCEFLISEDMQHGQMIGALCNLMIVNPFKL